MVSFFSPPIQEPESIKTILERLVRSLHLKLEKKESQVFKMWKEIVEPKTLLHTKPVSFQGQILKVWVDSPAIYFELVTFKKRKLLSQLQKKKPQYLCERYPFYMQWMHRSKRKRTRK